MFYLAGRAAALHLHAVCKDGNPYRQDPRTMVLQQYWQTAAGLGNNAEDLLLNPELRCCDGFPVTAPGRIPPGTPTCEPANPATKETNTCCSGLGLVLRALRIVPAARTWVPFGANGR